MKKTILKCFDQKNHPPANFESVEILSTYPKRNHEKVALIWGYGKLPLTDAQMQYRLKSEAAKLRADAVVIIEQGLKTVGYCSAEFPKEKYCDHASRFSPVNNKYIIGVAICYGEIDLDIAV